jgi:outer membrane lipoprotein-sorting protein
MPQLKSRITQSVLAAAFLALAAQGTDHASAAQPDHLQAVLSQMDAGSAKFQSAQADIKKEQFEKIVNDTTSQSGMVYFLRNGKSTQMGVKLDNGQVFEYKNGIGRLYNASTNHLDQFSASGENQARAETFFTLGFGGSGSDLKKAWAITDQGTEQLNDGSKTVPVEKLDLVSNDPGARSNFSHVTIWVDPVRDVSLKQEFFTPSGDTQTATYSNIRLNQKVNTDAFAIKCKGKCS